MGRKTIAVDIDDVLSATAEGFTAYSNERWGDKHKAEDYTEAWAEFWGVSLEEAIDRSKEYHDSDAPTHFKHYPESVPVLIELRDKYRLVVITSRRKVFKTMTDAWLEQYYPGIFDEVHYAGIWDAVHNSESVKHMLNQTKAELAVQLGADYLIDDQLKHCVGAASVGIKALLFGGRTTSDGPLPVGITPVTDWAAVQEYFNAQG